MNKIDRIKKIEESQKELLVEIEDKLDKINSENGSKNGYCIYCNTMSYNSKLGLDHFEDCIILELRNKIKEL